MVEFFVISLIVAVMLLIATIILFLCGLERLGAFTAIAMLIMLALLCIAGCFIELENILNICECGCKCCTG